MIKVVTLKNACPICGGDLKGSKEVKYLCMKCRMYFEDSLVRKLEHIKNIESSFGLE